jgi:hypothetical protein
MTPVSQTIYSLCLLASLFALMAWKVRRNRRLGPACNKLAGDGEGHHSAKCAAGRFGAGG